jgi:NAD(P)-dependent dehydrogenase (short-subunit alcohol dehydrogenase family)
MVVVITGASSGIGRTAALKFAAEGASLVLAARDASTLATVATDCEARGGNAIAVPTDVAEREQVEALAAAAMERFGRIDTWVNNAAVMAYGEFDAIPPDVFDRIISTNLLGQVYGSRVALSHFRERGEGVLINVGSLWGQITSPLVSPYVISKHGVRALGECLDRELVDEPDIHVSTVHPSAVDTPIFNNAGNYLGRRLRPVWPIFEPSYVADGIVACARSPKREITYGRLGRGLEVLYALSRPLYRRTAAGMFMGATFAPESAPESDGTVFDPAPEQTLDGGWRSDHKLDLARAFGGAVKGAVLGLAGQTRRVKP